MRSGDLRDFVRIERRVDSGTVDDAGAPVASWTLYEEVWAAIQPITGRELLASGEVRGEVTVRVRMRYVEGVTPDMRIVHGSTVYAIAAVIDRDMRHRELEILCSQGLARDG